MSDYLSLPTLHLHRTEHRPDRTLGQLRLYDASGGVRFDGWALEPPWRGNQRGVSSIPCGLYDLAHRYTARRGRHLLVLGTEPRTYILLHAGNWPRDTRGCILPGLRRSDLDGDRVPEVASSRSALGRIVKALPSTTAGRSVARLLVTSGKQRSHAALSSRHS